MKDNRPLWNKLKELPELPGIYQMLDSRGNIIYIGKSKCLKKRVHSYFVECPKWEKAKKMAPFIYDINYIVTDTHLEAMLLECEMIKSRKPYFNALMKNDERYVYLTISQEKKGKPLIVTYGREQISFGPFRSRSRLQEFVDSMSNLYPFTEKRKSLRFDYHFLPEKMAPKTWIENQRLLEKLFSVPEMLEEFLIMLEKKMKKAAREEKFETALKYRELIRYTKYVQKNLSEYSEWMDQQLIYTENTYKGRIYFFINNGLVIHKAILALESIDLIESNGLAGNSNISAESNGLAEKSNISADLFDLAGESETAAENSEQLFLKSFVKESRDILLRQEQDKGQKEDREKEKIDFQDIVYSEMARAEEKATGRIYRISASADKR